MLQMRGNKLTWFGHATFGITTPSGQEILIDPYLQSNPACPEKLKKLDRLDTMLLTHGHSDHIADAISIAKQFKPQVVGIIELCAWLGSKGVTNLLPMNKGGTQRVGEIEVSMVHAVHSSGIEDGGQMIYGGEASGLVVRLPGGLTIYHAGDTAVFSDMKLIAELYKPDLALLPIGDHFTMDPREAAAAIRLLGARHVVPMHYGTWPVLTGRPQQLIDLTQDIRGLEIHAIAPGDSMG
ncbi:MAG: metal-dependent hydrolase [Candidatus Acidiferrales bacterium]